MKQFRGKEVIGWKLIYTDNKKEFEYEINALMDDYNFEDFQFSINRYGYAAAILISEKGGEDTVTYTTYYDNVGPLYIGDSEKFFKNKKKDDEK